MSDLVPRGIFRFTSEDGIEHNLILKQITSVTYDDSLKKTTIVMSSGYVYNISYNAIAMYDRVLQAYANSL